MNDYLDFNPYEKLPTVRQLCAIDSEQNIIGTILLKPEKMHDIPNLKPVDFFDNQNALIFDAMLAISESNKPIDVVIIAEYFERRGQLENIGGMGYMVDLVKNLASSRNILAHTKLVTDKAKERRLVQAAQDIQDAIYQEGELSTEERLSNAEAIFTAANAAIDSSSEVVEMNTAVKDYIEYLSWRFDNEGIHGVKTGFEKIDLRLQGLKGGEMYIIAARPGMGKTTYATNILANACRQGVKAYFSSLEMPRNQLVQRMLASTGNIALAKLKDASILGCSQESAKLTMSISLVKDMNVAIDDQGGVDIADIRSRCRAKFRKGGLDILLVDYLQLIEDRTAKNRFEVVSSVSRKLKALAKELDIPVVALSQLSRKLEERPDKRPVMSDLRESGQIEQDADVIQFLYRDEVYNDSSNKKGICEVITAKFRDGETGTDYVAFFGAQNRMADLAHEYTPPADEQKTKKKGF